MVKCTRRLSRCQLLDITAERTAKSRQLEPLFRSLPGTPPGWGDLVISDRDQRIQEPDKRLNAAVINLSFRFVLSNAVAEARQLRTDQQNRVLGNERTIDPAQVKNVNHLVADSHDMRVSRKPGIARLLDRLIGKQHHVGALGSSNVDLARAHARPSVHDGKSLTQTDDALNSVLRRG